MQFGSVPGFRVFQMKPDTAEITGQLRNGRQSWEDATGNAVLTRSDNSLAAAFYRVVGACIHVTVSGL